MPQLRSANVINTPPCTRPRRLWCLSCVTRAYSCSPSTTRCHNGPIRCTKPVVSTMVQPEAFSFSVPLSVMLLSFGCAHTVVPAKAGTHNHRCWLSTRLGLQLDPNEHRWLWVPARASLGRDDEHHFINRRRVVVKRDGQAVR